VVESGFPFWKAAFCVVCLGGDLTYFINISKKEQFIENHKFFEKYIILRQIYADIHIVSRFT